MKSRTSRRMIPTSRVLIGLAAPGSLLLLVGCSAHAPVASSTSPGSRTTIEHSVLVDRHESGGGDARRVEQAIQRMEASHSAGQAALLAGDEVAAFDAFDEALDVVLRSEVDLDAFPDLRDRAEFLVASINELAVAASEAEDERSEEVPGLPMLDFEFDSAQVAEMWRSGDLQIPMAKHGAVDSMIRFYTGRAKDRFELGLSRYGKYAPTVSRIFQEEGVPGELAWLALVESNYNPQAYSRARARGLWQFIPSTGKRYGLKQDFWVDERSDFEKATRSAARYLKFLHGMFGDWHLAIAAYNAGEGKVGRAIKATGRKDFWHIRDTRYLRRETKDYVPAYLAVLTVVQDPAKYGINFRPTAPLDWEVAPIRSTTDLAAIAQCAGTTLEMIQDLNPELRRGTTPGGDQPYALRVPRGCRATFEERYAALPADQRLSWHRHEVARGETLARIAERYGTSTGAIMAANRMGSSTLALGQALLIPAGPSIDTVPHSVIASRAPHGVASTEPAAAVNAPSASSSSRRTTYRVRPGDTLGKIASRHGTSVAKLSDWNNLRNANKIHVGQRLTIYSRGSSPSSSGSTRTASASSSRSSVHVVRSGDTLSAIARKHGLTVTQLRRLNGLGNSNLIRPGQRLRIGGSGRASLDLAPLAMPLAPLSQMASATHGGSLPVAL